ncbi:hypothetical protein ACFQV8_31180 [Pseudonocardia benzenivorans]
MFWGILIRLTTGASLVDIEAILEHRVSDTGEGTGPNPCDRGRCGWKWSLGVERHKIPLGWAIEGANRNDDHRTPRSASPSPCSSSADHLTETSGCQRGSKNDTGSSNMNCVR